MMCYGKSILNGVNSGGQSPPWTRGSDHDLTAAGCLTTPYAGLEPYGGSLMHLWCESAFYGSEGERRE